MTETSQKTRVLASLRHAGPRGISQADWSGLHGTPDGGAPITRVAARVADLRADGHTIHASGRRAGCVVYQLVREHRPYGRPPEPEAAVLFVPPPENALTAA